MVTEGEKLSASQAAVPATSAGVYQALYKRRMACQYKDEPAHQTVQDREFLCCG